MELVSNGQVQEWRHCKTNDGSDSPPSSPIHDALDSDSEEGEREGQAPAAPDLGAGGTDVEERILDSDASTHYYYYLDSIRKLNFTTTAEADATENMADSAASEAAAGTTADDADTAAIAEPGTSGNRTPEADNGDEAPSPTGSAAEAKACGVRTGVVLDDLCFQVAVIGVDELQPGSDGRLAAA